MPLDRIRQNVISALGVIESTDFKAAIELASNVAEVFAIFIEEVERQRYVTEEEGQFLLYGDAEAREIPGATDQCGELVHRMATSSDAEEIDECKSNFAIELGNLILLRKDLLSTYQGMSQDELSYLQMRQEQRTQILSNMPGFALAILPERNREAMRNIVSWENFAVCGTGHGNRVLVIGDQYFSDGTPELAPPKSMVLVDDGESYVPGEVTFHYSEIFHPEYYGRIVPAGEEFDVQVDGADQKIEVLGLLSDAIPPAHLMAPSSAKIGADAESSRGLHGKQRLGGAIYADLGQDVRGDILKSNLALYADRPDRMRFSVRFATEAGERVPVLVLSVGDSVPLAGVIGLLPEEYAGEIWVEKAGSSVQKLSRMASLRTVGGGVAAGLMQVAVAAEYFEEVCELIRQNTGTGKKIVRV
ncbi:hypothetical protein [Streptomyces sp. NPDC051014]|uniref:hypothetical protein n=1 Tax=Streptomyces sp. NPDC051014 TaxID=3155751 RepID=UPI0033D5C38F